MLQMVKYKDDVATMALCLLCGWGHCQGFTPVMSQAGLNAVLKSPHDLMWSRMEAGAPNIKRSP